MASVQQLEKLYHIERIFKNDRSLESVVAHQRVQNVIQRTEQVLSYKLIIIVFL